MPRVAETLGVPRSEIIVLDKPKDTEEEAAAVKEAVGDAPFLLVTSASHLPRAMIFFRRAGLAPLPAPANQLAIESPLNPWERAIPSPVWLMHSDSGWLRNVRSHLAATERIFRRARAGLI
ncbi:membrane Protein [Klebsiella oxytoca]|nr:membrane Protein [Klebsiella oxytoca]